MDNPSDVPYRRVPRGRSVWYNVNNVSGGKGRAGAEPGLFMRLQPGDRAVVCEMDGPGIIDRLWMTFNWPVRTER